MSPFSSLARRVVSLPRAFAFLALIWLGGPGIAQAQIAVYGGENTTAPQLADNQAAAVVFAPTSPEISSVRVFTVQNQGGSDLAVQQILVTGPFRVIATVPPVKVIRPNETFSFAVTRAALLAEGDYTGTLQIQNNFGRGAFALPLAATVVTPIPPNPPNLPPVAVDDGVFALDSHFAAEFDVLDNDVEVEGQALTITQVAPATHGTVTITANGTRITYDPADDYGGADSFAYTIDDGAGGTATATVRVVVPSAVPVVKVLHVGGAVPFGTPVPLGRGTVFKTIGVPSVNDAGALAYAATLSDERLVAMAGAPLAIAVDTDEPAPGAAGASLLALGDPLWNSEDELTFVGRATGLGGTPAAKQAVWSGIAGNGVVPLVETGEEPPGLMGKKFAQFVAVAAEQDAVGIHAKLKAGRGVNARNDEGLWIHDGSALTQVLREGDPVTLNGQARKVVRWTALGVRVGFGPSVAGQGKGVANGKIVARVNTDDRGAAIMVVEAGAAREVARVKGPVPDFGANAEFLTLDLPTQAADNSVAFTGKVKPKTGTATAKNNVGVFAEHQGALLKLAARDESAPGVTGATFDQFGPPVKNARGTAFWSKLVGRGVVTAANNTGLWYHDGTQLTLLARAGDEPPGATGTQWKTFTALALPENAGPLFAATLVRSRTNGVNATNDAGLWMVNRNGRLQLLLRTGEVYQAGIFSRTVKSIHVLETVPGSAAQARSFSASGEVTCRVGFTDGTHGVVLIKVP